MPQRQHRAPTLVKANPGVGGLKHHSRPRNKSSARVGLGDEEQRGRIGVEAPQTATAGWNSTVCYNPEHISHQSPLIGSQSEEEEAVGTESQEKEGQREDVLGKVAARKWTQFLKRPRPGNVAMATSSMTKERL